MASEFEKTVRDEPVAGDLPHTLPLAHLTAWRWLEPILESGHLFPRECKVFSKKLLYFSYGGVFYRTSKLQTQASDELPVAMVFSPKILKYVSHFFPFDSGAMAESRFGEPWTTEMAPFKDRFMFENIDWARDPSLLVHHLYSSNSAYLHGAPRDSIATKPAPFPLLHRFLNADMSSIGVDHRQRTIEGVGEEPTSIGDHLLWIGFPLQKIDTILGSLRNCTGVDVPDYWPYPYSRNFNPSELAMALEMKAHEAVIKRYADYPA
jgi:hypothetical protein